MGIKQAPDISAIQRLLEISYKKLKSSVFFDKTQLVLRDKIVQEEDRIEAVIDRLTKQLINGDLSDITPSILKTISILTFPKKMADEESEKPDQLISNLNVQKPRVKDLQYFCDMSVEGYILGVAWLLVVGHRLDAAIYEHSYGNRLRKNLLDEETGRPTYSPYLFEPYFQQYEGWRDRALSFAQKSLAQGQDVVLLTLDFKRFYYQVDLTQQHLRKIVRQSVADSEREIPEEYGALVDPLTDFVWQVIETYSQKLREQNPTLIENRNVLPIGFHPSNVLANYCLKKFDDTLINGWNPLYYGRYVDDIIIVDKVEKNSKIYRDAQNGNLTPDCMIQYYLKNCSAWHRPYSYCSWEKDGGLFIPRDVTNREENEIDKEKQKKDVIYSVNPAFTEFEGSKLIVQNQKIKLFYFNAEQSDALLTCFQKGLRENKSEFRFLPEDEPVFQRDDYSEIYEFSEQDGPNKLRGVEGIRLDRFKLSKFLGKYMRISGLVEDEKESQFVADIDKIFTPVALIDQYISWEKVLSILAYNGSFDAYSRFVERIWRAIHELTKSENNSMEAQSLKDSLEAFLFSAIHKTLALIWGAAGNNAVEAVAKRLFARTNDTQILACSFINKTRLKYCQTRMCDKYALPILIDGCLGSLSELQYSEKTFNLTILQDALNAGYTANRLEEEKYKYYPYLITMNDLSIHHVLNRLRPHERHTALYGRDDVEEQKKLYVRLNYLIDPGENHESTPVVTKVSGHRMAIRVGDGKRDSVTVAVANTIVQPKTVEAVFLSSPDRSYQRYQKAVCLVNQAIENRADMLVLPESYWPFEWLPILARTCAKNQLAVVTGVEHLRVKNASGDDPVYNLTAVILPYVEGTQRFSYIHFHEKTHFAPSERQMVESYHCKVKEGKQYELYNWNDFWFSVYCCYELTSITDRALFQSYADALIAVEWNRDVNYYSSIVESLSRDLHCYCIQVNTAQYGDSRITQPSKTEKKDILKVKGGKNPAVLVDAIDIKALREFQLKGNVLQTSEGRDAPYKPTPPDFHYKIVEDKLLGKLWDNLKLSN
ncbi:MAG: hypothetical protein Q4C72_05335 [Eubacteriales bacterium]|nr:hypothetical protein [Eubacteriales bacterium]